MIGKHLALDVGLARIGIATCDPLGITVRPLTVITRRSRRDDFGQIAQIIQEEAVEVVVCGLPLSMDDSESEQTRTVRKWATRLAYALRTILGYPLPILFWDERLSTFEAQEILSERKLKGVGEDAAAAAVILQRYLDAKKAGSPTDYGHITLPILQKESVN